MSSFFWPPRGTSGGGGGGGSGSLVKATLYDPVDTTLPVGASAVIDGVTLTNGMTVLFSALLAGNNEIYTVSGVGVALVWTPLAAFGTTPSITPTAGDQVIFTQGTGFADQVATFNGTTWSVNNFVRYFNGVDYWEQSSLQNATLAANTTNDVFNIAFLGSENIIVSYSILRGSVKEVGQIFITTDGVTANVSVQSDYIGASGVTFFADIVGPNIRLRFTTDNSGPSSTMKYFLARWSDASGGPGGVPSYSSGSITSWLLGGNAGTNPGVNFIGTTDAQDLVFKTNGTETMRIIEATGEVHIPGKLTVDGVIDPTQILLSGADKRFGATDAGPIYLAPFTDIPNAVQIRLADNSTPVFSVDTDIPKITVTGAFSLSGGLNNAIASFNSTGELIGTPGTTVDTTSGGITQSLTENPNNTFGGQVNGLAVNFIPLQNSPNETWSLYNQQIFLDPTSTGFTFGTAGNAINYQGVSITHAGTSDVGALTFYNNTFTLGNGVDPINIGGIAYNLGFGQVSTGATVTGSLQGYGFQPQMQAGSFLTGSVNPFFDFSTFSTAVGGYTSFTSTPTLLSIKNNTNYQGLNLSPSIGTLTGNSGFTGVNVLPSISAIGTGNIIGYNFGGTLSGISNLTAINIDTASYFPNPGVFSSVVIQDLTFTAVEAGTNGDAITIQYTAGATAGSEVVSRVNTAITVQIDNGVSTANQIRAALLANSGVAFYINVTVSGVGGNAQTTVGATNLAGGVNPGTIRSMGLTGNATINGELQVSSDLTCGRLSSNAAYTVIDSGTNGNASVDFLVTSLNVPAASVIANADTIGVNTAALINVGAGATVTSGAFGLGLCALALPAVATIGAGATVDHINAAIFALSLGGGGGTIDEMVLCRGVTIPDGSTTINKLFGFKFDLPFGDPGTQTWGFYSSPDVNNWIKGSLKIGGTAGSTDVVTGGYKLDIQGSALIQTSLDLQDPGVGTFKIVVQAPTLAADWTLTLPVDNGTPGQVLSTDGSGVTSWVAAGSSGAAGAPTEIQFNTAGSLDADSDFTWDKTNNILTLGTLQYTSLIGPVTLIDNSTAVAITYDQTLFPFAVIEYSLTRDTDSRIGRLMVVNNGTIVTITDDENSTGDLGTTFTAALNAGNVEISYTLTNTGFNASLKYAMRRWG